MLTIWGRRTSSNVQAAMWAVAELGLQHIRHDAGHLYGVVDTEAFFALNPNRTVPVIEDDDRTAVGDRRNPALSRANLWQ